MTHRHKHHAINLMIADPSVLAACRCTHEKINMCIDWCHFYLEAAYIVERRASRPNRNIVSFPHMHDTKIKPCF